MTKLKQLTLQHLMLEVQEDSYFNMSILQRYLKLSGRVFGSQTLADLNSLEALDGMSYSIMPTELRVAVLEALARIEEQDAHE